MAKQTSIQGAALETDKRIVAKDVGLVYKIRSRRKKENRTLTALEHVDIEVNKGEFYALVGPSGCGKSTFLYILAGLIKKTSGALYINGHEIHGPDLDRGIIMQQYALFPWRTIRKNVELGLEVKGVKKEERERIALGFIDLVGLSEFADRYPYELSGGMKQRIAIARALAYDPDVLLMDEPFAAVDEQTRETLHDELLRIWEKTNKTIIFVTHSIDEAVFLADRVAVMTPSPGSIKEVVDINLGRPRVSGHIKSTQAFSMLRHRVWELLQNSGETADAGAGAAADFDVSEVISESAVL
ncbi:MAG: ABC transporter ATP-binding protein [Clostridiales Family XIII bacterium]|jgi:NitT/TauT family transport system ATP-binding protein|nr:ABC transporter ATP-binding protein [Clostridiales Family XIII bacterium]